jgi:hypothetical protein
MYSGIFYAQALVTSPFYSAGRREEIGKLWGCYLGCQAEYGADGE